MLRRITFGVNVLLFGVLIGCDKMPLTAPSGSTLTINAGSTVLPNGGSTIVTATVIEAAGTPVHNGTTVRFTATLGRVEPAEAQTNNGIATTTFFAGDASGVAEVRATSGAAGVSTPSTPTTPSSPTSPTTPTTPTTITPTNSNVIQIAVGSGAVDTVTVRANPSTVSTSAGGTVTVTATVVGTGGRLLSGIPVSFTATRGTLSSTSAVTDAQGEARVTLTTNGDTDITVAAGTKTATAKITGQPGPGVVLTCAIGTVTNCATATIGQTIIFTAARAQTSSNLTSATLDFGDGSRVNVGTLSASTNVPHAYTQAGTYTARLTATDANGESAESSQVVQVNAAASVSLQLTKSGLTVTGTVTLSGATATQFAWNFEGGTNPNYVNTSSEQTHTYTAAGAKTVTVTVTLSDGSTRTVSRTIDVP